MPALETAQRLVIAGASSLLGMELKSVLGRSRFAASDFRLLDEELESQTSRLCLLQCAGKPVFDTQVALNMPDRYRDARSFKPAAGRPRMPDETRLGLGATAVVPALRAVPAPVFYGTAFAPGAEFAREADLQNISDACRRAGFSIAEAGNSPGSVNAAGESVIGISEPEPDSAQPGTCWFWGAADRIHFPSAKAVKLADRLAS